MEDVFLSYSRHDREKAALIQSALKDAGFSVFWDQEIPPGRDWDSWIREHLTGAKVAVVLWSKASVASANVKHEAMIANENVKLIPVLVEDLSASDFPMGMYLTQAAVLTDYRGGGEHPGMKALVAAVAARVGRDAKPIAGVRKAARPRTLAIWIGATAALVAVAFLAMNWDDIISPLQGSDASQEQSSPSQTGENAQAPETPAQAVETGGATPQPDPSGPQNGDPSGAPQGEKIQ